jgi:preprotein translocase subunit SecG
MIQIVGVVVVLALIAFLVVQRKKESAGNAKPSRGSSHI